MNNMSCSTVKEYNRATDNLMYEAIAFARKHNISPEDVTGHPDFPAIIEKVVEKYFPNDLRKQESEAMRIGNWIERDIKFFAR